MVTENIGLGFLVGENDGQGIFASTDSTNRDFAAQQEYL
jgi:hypothetical protein